MKDLLSFGSHAGHAQCAAGYVGVPRILMRRSTQFRDSRVTVAPIDSEHRDELQCGNG